MDFKRFGLLGLLLFQNTFLALSIKASKSGEVHYINSTVVFLNEILKLIVCTALYLTDKNDTSNGNESKISYFFKMLMEKENLLYVIPCVIYAVQNNIVFIALGMIDAALYQVLANLKIITTGLFSVLMLQKSLHRLQWMALTLLAVGEALAENAASSSSDEESTAHSTALGGVMLMILFATLSGFAGTFMEIMFKKKNTNMSFWMRSMLLYFWGAVVNGILVLLNDGSQVAEKGFFYGYFPMTWIALCLLAFGGLLVSVVITQFDNITKVYVTCLAIFTTSIFSYYIFEFHYNLNFILAAFVVCISILVYNDPATVPPVIQTVTNPNNNPTDITPSNSK